MNNRRLAVLIGCYGNFPQYSLRAVRSAVAERGDPARFELLVGANVCGTDTLQELRALYDQGAIDALIESRENINKCPMKRLLIDRCQSEYYLWLDDDSHLLPGWFEQVERFLSSEPAFEAAGVIHHMRRSKRYRVFLKQRPWFEADQKFIGDFAEAAHFATGGCYIARTEFVRRHNYPDKAMVKHYDDLLLGDLVAQKSGRLLQFPQALMEKMRISDGERRGIGEDTSAYRKVDPITGKDIEAKESSPGSAEAVADIHYEDPDLLLLNERGNQLFEKGELEQAAATYHSALELSPNSAELHYNLANVYRIQGRRDLAISHFEKALKINPEYVDALNNLGVIQEGLGRDAFAMERYRRAVELDPRCSAALNNMGNIELRRGSLQAAAGYFRRALQVDPELSQAHFSLGCCLAKLGEAAAALVHLQSALRGAPNLRHARTARASIWLQHGEFEQGWLDYQWRVPTASCPVDARAWSGEELSGKRLLVWMDVGYVEALIFLRFISNVIERGAEVTVLLVPELAELLPPQDHLQVVTDADRIGGFDFQIALGRLPQLLNVRADTLHSRSGYLIAPRGRPELKGKFKVGVRLRGERGMALDVYSPPSFEGSHLKELQSMPGIELTILDGDLRAEELSLIGMSDAQAAERRSVSFQAAAVAEQNLVVSVDSVTAHLAGALGVPLLLLSGECAHWPWGSAAAPCWYERVSCINRQHGVDPSKMIDQLKKLIENARSSS